MNICPAGCFATRPGRPRRASPRRAWAAGVRDCFLPCGPVLRDVLAERNLRRAQCDLLPQMKKLLAEPQVTVAVLSLRTLAERGGLLDGLEAAGFDIQGPAWK